MSTQFRAFADDFREAKLQRMRKEETLTTECAECTEKSVADDAQERQIQS